MTSLLVTVRLELGDSAESKRLNSAEFRFTIVASLWAESLRPFTNCGLHCQMCKTINIFLRLYMMHSDVNMKVKENILLSIFINFFHHLNF